MLGIGPKTQVITTHNTATQQVTGRDTTERSGNVTTRTIETPNARGELAPFTVQKTLREGNTERTFYFDPRGADESPNPANVELPTSIEIPEGMKVRPSVYERVFGPLGRETRRAWVDAQGGRSGVQRIDHGVFGLRVTVENLDDQTQSTHVYNPLKGTFSMYAGSPKKGDSPIQVIHSRLTLSGRQMTSMYLDANHNGVVDTGDVFVTLQLDALGRPKTEHVYGASPSSDAVPVSTNVYEYK